MPALLRRAAARCELAVINTIGQGLAEQLEFQGIIDLVATRSVIVFDAQVAFIVLYDRRTDSVTIHTLQSAESDRLRTYYRVHWEAGSRPM
jgi:hypothetical protein